MSDQFHRPPSASAPPPSPEHPGGGVPLCKQPTQPGGWPGTEPGGLRAADASGSAESAQPAQRDGGGCVAAVVRVPVQIVALLVFVPLRFLWEGLRKAGRALRRVLWRPLVRACAWLWRTLVVRPVGWLWRCVLAPVGRGVGWLLHICVLAPLRWLGYYLLVVPGRALSAALLWLVRLLLVTPAAALWRWLLVPLGLAIGAVLAWLAHYLLAVPLLALYRWVLLPACRGVAKALRAAWHGAGHVARALWTVLRWLLVIPVVWVWKRVLRPFGRGVRDGLWRPLARGARAVFRPVGQAFSAARASVRRTRAEIRRALFGSPRSAERKEP